MGLTMHLLLDTRSDKAYTGQTLVELVFDSGLATIDQDARCAVVKGKPDTVTFSTDFTDKEFVSAAAHRTLSVLQRHYGFLYFKQA